MGHANYIHLIMKTKEERAKIASEGYDDDGYSAGLYMGYVEGATEQKVIDIDKACKWLEERVQCDVHPQRAYGFAEEVRKAMEK